MISYQSSSAKNIVRLDNSDNNYIESDNLQDLLNFLLNPQPDQFRVVWDLEQFVAPILKKLKIEYLERLYTTGRIWIKESGHSFTYNPRKSLYLTWGSKRVKYYHLSQFFSNGGKPENLQGIKAMGERLLAELDTLGIEPEKLTSPVTALEPMWNKIDFVNYEELPDEVGQMAWDCCERPWVEAHRLGHFDKAYDMDITSSFPSACAELLDLRYGKWVECATVPDKAYYGFAKGRVNIKSKISPIVYANESGNLFNPIGKWNTTLSLQEIRFIEKYGMGGFKIQSGWWWIPKLVVIGHEEKYMPFKKLINDLYSYRNKSPILNYVIKKSLVGLYGKWLQTFKDDTFSNRFNPVYGAMIEIQIRLKVAEFVLSKHLEDRVIHISTDGCLLDKRVRIKSSGLMGEWRLDSSGPALVVSSGCLFYGEKRPNQITYPEAMKMIESKPETSSWSKSSRRMLTVGDVIESGDLEKIGNVMPIVIGFGLKNQHDRDFRELPDTGVGLLEKQYRSQPIRVGKLSKPKVAD